jgi:hypothetical protein
MIGLHEIPKEQTLGMFFIRSTGQCSIGECYESRLAYDHHSCARTFLKVSNAIYCEHCATESSAHYIESDGPLRYGPDYYCIPCSQGNCP